MSTAAVAQQPPGDAFRERLELTFVSAYQWHVDAYAKLCAIEDVVDLTLPEQEATQIDVCARFGETWSLSNSLWWTRRVTGTANPFDPTVSSIVGTARALDDLVLWPVPPLPFPDGLSPEFASWLAEAPGTDAQFVFSARFDSDLRVVGYASSYVVGDDEGMEIEVLWMRPRFRVPNNLSVLPAQYAARLMLAALTHAGVDHDLYDDLVLWLVGGPDTSLDGPIVIPTTDGSGCNGARTLECLNQVWAQFCASKSSIADSMRSAAAAETDSLAVDLAGIAAAQRLVEMERRFEFRQRTGISLPPGYPIQLPPGIDDEFNWLHQEADGASFARRQQHLQRLREIRDAYCVALRNAMDAAIAAAKECVADHCPGLSADFNQQIDATRAALQSYAGC